MCDRTKQLFSVLFISGNVVVPENYYRRAVRISFEDAVIRRSLGMASAARRVGKPDAAELLTRSTKVQAFITKSRQG